MDFGRLLRSWRAAAGLSQQALAERSGISKNYVGILERDVSSPSIDIVEAVAAGLGTDVAGFLAGPIAGDSSGASFPHADERRASSDTSRLSSRLESFLSDVMNSDRSLSAELGFSGTWLDSVLAGHQRLSTVELEAICKKLGVSADYLLELEELTPDNNPRRIAAVDLQSFLNGSSQQVDDLMVPARLRAHVKAQADLVGVTEDSTTLIVDRSETVPEPGMTVIVKLGGEPVVGRVTRSGDSMLVVPRRGDPQLLPNDAEVLGQVVARFEDLVLEAMLPNESKL